MAPTISDKTLRVYLCSEITVKWISWSDICAVIPNQRKVWLDFFPPWQSLAWATCKQEPANQVVTCAQETQAHGARARESTVSNWVMEAIVPMVQMAAMVQGFQGDKSSKDSKVQLATMWILRRAWPQVSTRATLTDQSSAVSQYKLKNRTEANSTSWRSWASSMLSVEVEQDVRWVFHLALKALNSFQGSGKAVPGNIVSTFGRDLATWVRQGMQMAKTWMQDMHRKCCRCRYREVFRCLD